MPTNTTLGGGGFHHVAIRVRNFDATIRFYSDVLGFKEKVRWGEGDKRAMMLDTGDGNYLEVFAGGPAQQPEGLFYHVAFRTTECDAVVARARAAGAQITTEPKDVAIPSTPPTKVRLAFFKGPDGEMIELFQCDSL